MSDSTSPAGLDSDNRPDVEPVELAIVGGGNMGAALLGGLLAGGVLRPVQVAVVERLPERRVALEGMFPGCSSSMRSHRVGRRCSP